MTKSTKKIPQLLNRQQLAGQLNVHMQTIVKWADRGLPIAEPGRRGNAHLYDLAAVQKWRSGREEAAKENGNYDVQRERARKDRAQAILAEQTIAIRAGELLLKSEAEAAWTAVLAAIRARLLAWPTTLADRLYRASAIGGVSALEQKLKDEVYDVLTELSQAPQKKQAAAKKKAAKKKVTKKKVTKKKTRRRKGKVLKK